MANGQFFEFNEGAGLNPLILDELRQGEGLGEEGQRRLEEQEQREGREEQLGGAEQAADIRAETTFNQLRQAGLLDLANQFNRARKRIAFDTARRGTLGGSRSIERAQGADVQLQQGLGQNLVEAQQFAEQQRQADIAPIFGAQQEVAQGDPFLDMLRQQELRRFQDEATAAQGRFGLDQLSEGIRSGISSQRGANIQGSIGGISQGIEGITVDRQNEDFLRQLDQILNPSPL